MIQNEKKVIANKKWLTFLSVASRGWVEANPLLTFENLWDYKQSSVEDLPSVRNQQLAIMADNCSEDEWWLDFKND